MSTSKELVAKWVDEHFGQRCAAHTANCHTCAAWWAFDNSEWNDLEPCAIATDDAWMPTLEQLQAYAYELTVTPRGEPVPVQMLEVFKRQVLAAWRLRPAPVNVSGRVFRLISEADSLLAESGFDEDTSARVRLGMATALIDEHTSPPEVGVREAAQDLIDTLALGPLGAAAKYGPDVDVREIEIAAIEALQRALAVPTKFSCPNVGCTIEGQHIHTSGGPQKGDSNGHG